MSSTLFLGGCGDNGSDIEPDETVQEDVTTETDADATLELDAEMPFGETDGEVDADTELYTETFAALDLSGCEEIENDIAKDSCINNIIVQQAKTSTDTSVCDQTTNEEAKSYCLEQVGADLSEEIETEGESL